jgi:hypothetical protein
VIFAAPSLARARVQEDFTYAWAQVWQASVRLVRVDLNCELTDRDPDIGYVTFEYPDRGRTHHGSLELVRTTGADGVERVRVVAQIPSMPSYVERMMIDRLTRKLRDDFGAPPRATRSPRPSSPEEPPAPPSEPASDSSASAP